MLFDRKQRGVLCPRRGRNGWEGHSERLDESWIHKASSSIRFASFGEFLGAAGGRKKGAPVLRTGREEGQVEAQKKMSTCRPVHSCKDYALFLRCTSLRLRPGSTSCGAKRVAAMEMSHIKSTRHMKSTRQPARRHPPLRPVNSGQRLCISWHGLNNMPSVCYPRRGTSNYCRPLFNFHGRKPWPDDDLMCGAGT